MYKLVGYLALVLLDEGSRTTVVVVIVGACAIIVVVFEVGRKLKLVSETGEFQCAVATHDATLELYRAILVDCPHSVRSKVEAILVHRLFVVHNSHCVVLVAHDAATERSLCVNNILNNNRAIFQFLVVHREHPINKIVESVRVPCAACPVVIINGCTEGTEFHCVSCGKNLLVAVNNIVKNTLFIVEYNGKGIVGTLNSCCLQVGSCLHCKVATNVGNCSNSGLCGRRLQQQLLGHLNIVFLGPGHILFEQELNLYKILFCSVALVVDAKVGNHSLAGSNSHRGQNVAPHLLAILPKRNFHVKVAKVAEVAFVENLNFALSVVSELNANILVHFLNLVVFGLGSMVGQHHSVHTEKVVVGAVAKVTTVTHIFVTFFVVVVECLVGPVPYCATTEEVCALHCVPIVLKVTAGVTH